MRIAGTSRCAGRRGAKNSERHAGRSQIAIQLGGDKFGPEDLGLALACGKFRIPRKEGMTDAVSEEGHQREQHSVGARIRARYVGSISAPFPTPSVPFERGGFLNVQAAAILVLLYRAEETQEGLVCSRAPLSRNEAGKLTDLCKKSMTRDITSP